MAKYKVTVEFDTESGDYSLEPHNLSNPGTGIDYHMMMTALGRIFGDFKEKMGDKINQSVDETIRGDN